MPISNEAIDKARYLCDIVEFFSEYTELHKDGNRYRGKCPFPGHNDTSQSFLVLKDKQLYFCFGCKKSGTIITAVEELKSLSLRQALAFLQKRAGLSEQA